MYWQDKETPAPYRVPTDVVDLCFRVRCARLPVDHAYALGATVAALLPWVGREFGSGLHLMHGAESGNGWYRPASGEYLEIPRRSRLRIRTPRQRVEEVVSLTGTTLEIDDCTIDLGDASEKLLSPSAVVFSRYVALHRDESEEAFLGRCAESIRAQGVAVRKLMCGRPLEFSMPEGTLTTRSLMIADLEPWESVALQQSGIGEKREYGMGMVLPHKGIDAVYRDRDE